MWVATAIIGSAVIGGIFSSSNAKKAASAANRSADAANLQAEIGAEQWDRYKQIYDPLERQYVDESFKYGTPADYEKERGGALASVDQQFGKARDRLGRTPGLDPSSGAYTASLAGLDLAQAATGATQENAANNMVTARKRAYQQDALSMGKGLPAQAAATLGDSSKLNAGIANQQNQWGLNTATAIGNVANRIFTPQNAQGMADWFKGSPTAETAPGFTGTGTFDTSGGAPAGYGGSAMDPWYG